MDKKDFAPVFLTISALFSVMAMCSGDSPFAIGFVNTIFRWVNYLNAGILIILLTRQEKETDRSRKFVIFSVLAFFLLSNFDTYQGYRPAVGFLNLVLLIIVTAFNDSTKIQAYKMFYNIFVIMSICGIAAYISFITGIGLPYKMVSYYNDYDTNALYANFQVAYLCVVNDNIRLCGLLNEPGFLGTLISLFLIVERFRLSKWQNLILFMAGFLTFSVAYFTTCILYLLLLLYKKNKYFCVAGIVLLILWIQYIPQVHFTNPTLEYTVHRMELSDGNFAGDNRSSERIDKTLNTLPESGHLFWGYGNGYMSEQALTYKTFIISYGYIGIILFWGTLILGTYIKCEKRRYSLFLWLCFIVNLYQRPGVYSVAYFLILLGGIAYLNQQEKDKPIFE